MAETFSYSCSVLYTPGLSLGSVVKNLPANAAYKRCGFDAWVRRIPWRRAWQPTPVFLPEYSQEQRSLVGYSPWGHKELDTSEWLSTHSTHHLWAGSAWCANTVGYAGLHGEHIKQTSRQRAFKTAICLHLNQVTVIWMNISKTGQIFKLTGSVTSLWIHINILILQVKNSVSRHRRSVSRTYFSTTWSRQPCPLYDPFDKKINPSQPRFKSRFILLSYSTAQLIGPKLAF